MPRKRDARFPELNWMTSATEDPQSKAGTQKPVTGEQTHHKNIYRVTCHQSTFEDRVPAKGSHGLNSTHWLSTIVPATW